MRRRVLLGACAALVFCVAAPPTLAADPPHPADPGYCGKFHADDYVIWVYRSHLSCHEATAIQREYWLGKKKDRKVINGGSGANGYVLLKKYPGWRCFSGTGGGACIRGKSHATYENAIAG